MEQSKVTTLLASNGIKPIVTDRFITWEEKGCNHIRASTQNHSQLTYEKWSAKLTFRRGKLEEIGLDCQ